MKMVWELFKVRSEVPTSRRVNSFRIVCSGTRYLGFRGERRGDLSRKPGVWTGETLNALMICFEYGSSRIP
jgi:hypothetical protein